ncbi:MAG TPA: hypothetical protein VEK55_02770 [Xanthobacteraceae bacterium]|nr:hypothetical protein [Xanthobacteraceae bacterium]
MPGFVGPAVVATSIGTRGKAGSSAVDAEWPLMKSGNGLSNHKMGPATTFIL